MDPKLFDFSDVSDLPEDLQEKVQQGGAGKAQEYADIVVQGKAAGLAEMTINQIIAVAIRMGKTAPKQNTVRSYLNNAVKMGLLVKPTNLTYGAAEASEGTKTKAAAFTSTRPDATVSTEPSASEAGAEPAADDDPLAGLGLDTE